MQVECISFVQWFVGDEGVDGIFRSYRRVFSSRLFVKRREDSYSVSEYPAIGA